MKVRVKRLDKELPLPKYETADSAGLDVRSRESLVLKPGEHKAIGTGLAFSVPKGFEMQIRPRSGLAAKHGISIVNSPGTLDSDYRGELMIILINHSREDFPVNKGDRIAQIVFNKFEQAEWEETEELDKTDRGEGGLGSTGV